MTDKPGWGGAIAAVVIGYAVGVALALQLTRGAPAVEAETVMEQAG